MKSLLLAFTLAMAYAGTDAGTVDEEKAKALDQFFTTIMAREKYEKSVVAGFEASTEAGLKQVPLPEEQKAKMRAAMEKVKEMMLKELSWDKIKPRLAEGYGKLYTKEELKEINDLFAKTPVLQKMVKNEIEILPTALAIGQEEALKLMPKIQQIMMEEMMPK